MALPAWVAYVLVAAIVAGLTIAMVQMIREYLAERVTWVSIPCGIDRVTMASKVRVDVGALGAAVDRAFGALARFGPWPTEALAKALAGLQVQVKETESWTGPICGVDCRYGPVSGQSRPEVRAVVVGPSFAALCHEMAHVAEYQITGTIDYPHAGWSANGLMAADAAYSSAS